METLKDGKLYSGLERNQTVVYAVTLTTLLSLLRTNKTFFENNITALKDKPTDVNVFALL